MDRSAQAEPLGGASPESLWTGRTNCGSFPLTFATEANHSVTRRVLNKNFVICKKSHISPKGDIADKRVL